MLSDCLLGIDIGSTTIKAVTYSIEGNLIGVGTHPNRVVPQDDAHPDWLVWHPDEMWNAVCSAVQQSVRPVGDSRRIRGVATSGMGHDGLPIDRSGKWLYPAISWHDGRTAIQNSWWDQHFDRERLYRITGYPMLPIASINRIMWIKENEPEVYSQIWKWLMVEDYIVFRLSGQTFTDYTLASTTLAFDQTHLDWSTEVLGVAGIDPAIMAPTCASGVQVGAVSAQGADATGLTEGTPVVSGAHDYFCAALAANALDEGTMCDASGTWEIISVSVPRPILTDSLFREELICESHVAKHTYGIVSSFLAGGLIEWFREHFGMEETVEARRRGGSPYKAMEATARKSSPGSSGVFLLPYFVGSGSRPENSKCKGALVGLTSLSTRADIVRAFFEGLSYEMRRRIEAIEKCTGRPIKVLRVVGGAQRNDLWLSCKAEVTGKQVEIPRAEEATALGAAMLAGIGVGVFQNEREAAVNMTKVGKVVEPDVKRMERYDLYYSEIYAKLYHALKDVHWKIDEMFRK